MAIATSEQIDQVPGGTHRDQGFSIVELVVTIAILGVLLTPLMSAAIATVRASTSTRNLAQVQTVLQNAADRVNRAPKGCDYTVYAQAAAQSQGWPAGQATIVQSRYVPGSTPAAAGSWLSGACSGLVPDALLVQVVTVTVTSPDGSTKSSVQVVKSDI